MIERSDHLAPAQLAELAELEARAVAADGGRLKLEKGGLGVPFAGGVPHALAHEGDRLVGFLGAYCFGSATVELSGTVDPVARRTGLGTALLEAVLADTAGREVLLVVPRPSAGGHALARAHGGQPAHSEHAMLLEGEPADGPSDPALVLRPAEPGDAPAVARLLAAGFGGNAAALEPHTRARLELTWVGVLDGVLVAALRADLEGTTAGVHGFVVDPARQGRGLGRDVLRRTCLRLRASGAERVELEVATENERALGLYTSLGFRPVAVEDYYRLSAPSIGHHDVRDRVEA